MAPAEYTRLLRLAQLMGNYGVGYGRGLRRHFLGEDGLLVPHTRWMTLASSSNPRFAAAGRGYRDGLAGSLPAPGADEGSSETSRAAVPRCPVPDCR